MSVNGFKIPIKSNETLIVALTKLINDNNLRKNMGLASRLKAERDFDQKEIIAFYNTQILKIFVL